MPSLLIFEKVEKVGEKVGSQSAFKLNHGEVRAW